MYPYHIHISILLGVHAMVASFIQHIVALSKYGRGALNIRHPSGQQTSTRPPVRDEYSRISDEWISKSTCPTERVEFAQKKMFFSTEV